ncbi:MAG: 30S ribosome-binding factor RbfA [Armatimonadota bacterium]
MPSQRIRRVENLLRSEISSILLRKIKDPRVEEVTVTEVDVSPDLKNATVFFSVLRGAEQAAPAGAGLQSAAGFIRAELMKTLNLRPMPVLSFELDRSLERGSHTLDLLDRIRHEREDDLPPPGE